MARMGRPGLSDQQKAELWLRWQQGQSLSEIGLALGKHAGSIHGVISLCGGITPALRRRARWCLTVAERESISRGLAAGLSMRAIARSARITKWTNWWELSGVPLAQAKPRRGGFTSAISSRQFQSQGGHDFRRHRCNLKGTDFIIIDRVSP